MKAPNRLSVIAVIVLSAVSFTASAQAPTSYRLTQIFKRFLDPGHENDEFEVTGINDKGQVVGYRLDANTGGFIWRNGEFRILNPSSDAVIPRAWGINDWSEVAGDYVSLPSERQVGFFWRDGQFTLIDAVAGASTFVLDLNNRRQVLLGVRDFQQGTLQYFIWRRGQLTPLESLPGRITTPQRLNGRGVVVGNADAGGGSSVPVIWQDGSVTALEPPEGATSSIVRDINDHNTVLIDAARSYLWQDGEYTALPVLAGRERTEALSLNNSGVVVGSTTGAPGTVATAWYSGRPVDLNTLVRRNDPLEPFARLERALVVNDRGEIVATGQDSRDTDPGNPQPISAVIHYLLTPID